MIVTDLSQGFETNSESQALVGFQPKDFLFESSASILMKNERT
ncbi:hypothetical protein LEP1GSC188_2038 [Leptospira weilii serovar Topaz str. LT2116]|uniref:Uncharacterized protein n=1 Tax=Leptospira weilii serovar Topaz str. LT2116 TaxID=1088540 RepID=M3GBT3_9LEPT|nr:hypothetical protein LEP1GSC188_2038 [Leptospira weilii serovar Topaz str. LT2116]